MLCCYAHSCTKNEFLVCFSLKNLELYRWSNFQHHLTYFNCKKSLQNKVDAFLVFFPIVSMELAILRIFSFTSRNLSIICIKECKEDVRPFSAENKQKYTSFCEETYVFSYNEKFESWNSKEWKNRCYSTSVIFANISVVSVKLWDFSIKF